MTKQRKPTTEETDFVSEYMVDFNPVRAAVRMGFPLLQAKRKAKQLMSEPVVLRMLQTRIDEMDPEQICSPQRLLAGLLGQAADPSNWGQTKVQAYKTIHDILKDLRTYKKEDKKEKEAERQKARGGVMRVPAEVPLSDWERKAMASQADLKEKVRNVVEGKK